MTILFVSPDDDPADWVPALSAELPDRPIRVAPDLGPDPAAIRYALAWAPPPGLLGSLPALRAVLWLGAGVDRALADPNLPPDIPLYRLIDPGLTQGMVEYVVEQVMAWHRRALIYRRQQAAGVWQQHRPVLAGDRTVGLLGLGVLGAACATALAGLGFRVAGWSRTQKSIPGVASHTGEAGLQTVLATADILVCLLPLTPETKGFLNAARFARMKPGAVVVNAGRGAQIVDADLLAALDTGAVAGASLDVFDPEPLPADHPYWRHPSVILTPHVASLTPAATGAKTIAATIRALEAGAEAAEARVSRDRGY